MLGTRWDIFFGTLTTKVKPFLKSNPRSPEELDKCQKKLDAKLDDVVEVELRHPSFISKGHIIIRLKSQKTFKLLLLNSTEDYSKQCFEAARNLLQKNIPGVLKVT